MRHPAKHFRTLMTKAAAKLAVAKKNSIAIIDVATPAL
jgi:hypothetical protein